MAAPSLQTGKFDTNLRHQIEKEGGFTGIFTYLDVMASFPVGAVWWWADEATIPAGWQLAPQALGSYIVAGWEGAEPWSTGGTITHTHDTHGTHTVDQQTDHSVAELESSIGWPTLTQEVQAGTGVTVAAYNHEHDWFQLTHDAQTVTAHEAHSEAQHLPPYTVLFLIVKVA